MTQQSEVERLAERLEGMIAEPAWLIFYMSKTEAAIAIATLRTKASETDKLTEAAQSLLDRMTNTYTAHNGQQIGIQDDGEKCWLVHSDAVEELRRALLDRLNHGEKA